MDKHLLELYSDYLLSSFGATTATGLSALMDGAVSHDQVTRFLSHADYDGKTLWQQVEPLVREIEQADGVLIVDDTIQAKPQTDENEQMRQMLRTCQHNQLPYRYVLADSWFSAKDNLTFIRKPLHKHFVVALKSNRTVALSYEQKSQGAFSCIDACDVPEHQPAQGWIKRLDFPVLLLRQVFTNQDRSTGTLYLACSDLTCEGATIETSYQKRWNVETFHKTLKSHTALAKSPTKRERTQSNHVFMAIYAACRLEGLRVQHRLNHFALRSRLYLKAIRCAFDELQTLKTAQRQ